MAISSITILQEARFSFNLPKPTTRVSDTTTPLIHVHMAEDGGWNPDSIKAEVGKPLHLRLTSDDVVHGFAVGQMNMEGVDVLPGKVTDVTLTFDKPGIYTFFCTRWCGLNHWRMRGTIEVGGSTTDLEPAPVPLYVTLGIDIDAPHEAGIIPSNRPSAISGQRVATDLDLSKFNNVDLYRTSSPYQVFEELNSTQLTDAEKWDVVSSIWLSNTTPESLANGKKLFAQNCVACHRENGAGDGVFADEVALAGESSMQTMAGAENSMMQTPADFTDPTRMLGASPALLQGKILRGGMGTGMPTWGSIFTEKQIWDLVAYLYLFQFEYEKQGGWMAKKNQKYRKQKQRKNFPWLFVALGGGLLLLATILFARGGDGGGTSSLQVDQDKIDYGYIKFGENCQFAVKVINTGERADSSSNDSSGD